MSINILDSMIINRISAGEVVESPFSIVKELIDNALDAGADKIAIDIKNGGIDQIIIKDNGKGIEKDDIKKAFLPHATSKIKDINDLESIMTLGFRGEALASISNVSQVSLTTKTKDSDCAYSIEVNGGVFSEVCHDSGDNGTKITVNNLFYNTPARRKFLKKPKQEESAITNIISRYILAHPTVNFKYLIDGKTIFQTIGKTLFDAIYCVYGAEHTQNIMPIEKTIGNIKLSGYVSKLGFSKPNTTYQTLIINSRYVIDEIVSKAMYMAFEEYLMSRQFPFYVLNLEMPFIDIDVNVHPSKMNVKFAYPSKIYDLVYTAVRSAIYQAISPKENTTNTNSNESNIEPQHLIKTDLSSLKEIEIEPVISSKSISQNNSELLFKQNTYTNVSIFDNISNESISDIIKNTPTGSVITTKDTQHLDGVTSRNISNIEQNKSEINDHNHLRDLHSFSDFKIVGELFNEFLLLEKDDLMLLVDFHAGHERLNYDKFIKMIENRNIVIQDLLIPYVHDLTEQEVDYILQLKDNLSNIGFDIDSFGDKKIIINSVPLQLKDINLKNFINDLLHDMKNYKPKMDNEIRQYLASKACKSSVKSGMKLSEMEIKDLLRDLDFNHPVLLCPHGRPIITILKRSQIEKWFKRIV